MSNLALKNIFKPEVASEYIATVKSTVSPGVYRVVDSSGGVKTVTSNFSVRSGSKVLIVNGIITKIVTESQNKKVYEV